jgi:hypothetical protein
MGISFTLAWRLEVHVHNDDPKRKEALVPYCRQGLSDGKSRFKRFGWDVIASYIALHLGIMDSRSRLALNRSTPHELTSNLINIIIHIR